MGLQGREGGEGGSEGREGGEGGREGGERERRGREEEKGRREGGVRRGGGTVVHGRAWHLMAWSNDEGVCSTPVLVKQSLVSIQICSGARLGKR